MQNKIAATGWVLAVAVILLTPSRALADPANLSASSPLTISQGSSFALDVNIANVTDLFDFQFDLTFDPSLLQATEAIEGAFLPGGGDTFFVPGIIDNTGGSVLFNADSLLSAISGVTGSGTLVEFNFAALASGTSPINIANIILQDSNSDEIQSSSTSASITVTGGGPVPTPEPNTLIMLMAALSWIMIRAAVRGWAGILSRDRGPIGWQESSRTN